MDKYTLEVSLRTAQGSAASNRIRREGLIPAIVYQRGVDSVSALLHYNSFYNLAERSRPTQVFTLKSDSKELNGRAVLVRTIQRDYVSSRIKHVDLMALKDDEPIHVDVSIEFKGVPVGVKAQGGQMLISHRKITVSCLPKDIPTELVVDISGIALGVSLHANEIELPKGVELYSSPEEPLVSVYTPKGAETEETATEGAEAGEAGAEKKEESSSSND